MVSSSCVDMNLQQVTQWMKKAKEEQVDLVVLPENFAFMGMNESDKLSRAEVHGQGPIQDKIRELAKALKIWVVAGTIPIKNKGTKVRASSLVFDEAGLEVARYDKIHLFDVKVSDVESHQESLTIDRGHEVVVVATPVGKMGLSVCYDLRFPELFHRLLLKGAELFAVPSAFTSVTGMAHWDVLLRARAVENLSYVLAANQGGLHENGRHTYGHSMVIEPWGKVLAQMGEGQGLIHADIDLIRLKKLRQQFPCLDHHVLV